MGHFFLEKYSSKNELNYCLSIKLYILMIAYHTNICFSFLNAAKDRKADYNTA